MKNFFRWQRAYAIAKKEVAHITRDKFTLSMALVLPLIVVTIFGVAIEFNLNDISTSFLDLDKTQSSRELMETFTSSDYFHGSSILTPSEGYRRLQSDESKVVVIIPPDFEKDLISGGGSQVQVLVDAADGQAASSVLSYLGDIQPRAFEKLTGYLIPQNIQLKTRFLFNPELNSKWFTVPGLLVVIMTMIAILLTALTVAREWETGSMELLLSTPVKPLEIIIGKLAPYAVLCLGAVGLVYILARIAFHVPFVGSYADFLLACSLFLITYLAQGLMISVLTRKQMLAMQLAMISGLLPSQLLSGFIFPVENMPPFFQRFTMILPARWFMNITRDSFLQGSTFWQMRSSFLGLTIIGLVFITVAVKKFKRDLEP